MDQLLTGNNLFITFKIYCYLVRKEITYTISVELIMLINIARWIKLYGHEGMKYLPSVGKYSFAASTFNSGRTQGHVLSP
jgi:hypothetical protein